MKPYGPLPVRGYEPVSNDVYKKRQDETVERLLESLGQQVLERRKSTPRPAKGEHED